MPIPLLHIAHDSSAREIYFSTWYTVAQFTFNTASQSLPPRLGPDPVLRLQAPCAADCCDKHSQTCAHPKTQLWYLLTLKPCHTRAACSRRLRGVQEKSRTPWCAQWGLLQRRGRSVAALLDAVRTPRTPCHGAHFEHAQSARRRSAL